MNYTKYLLPVLLLSLVACKQQVDNSDAYGNFEAIEVIVSAESSGRIISFLPGEGTELRAGQVSVNIDTTQLYLQKLRLESGFSSLGSRIKTLDAQLLASRVQLDNLERERKRIEKLVEGGAATSKQLDDRWPCWRPKWQQLHPRKTLSTRNAEPCRSRSARWRTS